MNIPTVYTYKVRTRVNRDPDGWLSQEAFDEGSETSHPFVLMRQQGTERRGWPWARYDHPTWKYLGVLKDLREVPDRIEADLAKLIAYQREKLLADDKRAALPEGGLQFTATVILGASPKTDTISVTAN